MTPMNRLTYGSMIENTGADTNHELVEIDEENDDYYQVDQEVHFFDAGTKPKESLAFEKEVAGQKRDVSPSDNDADTSMGAKQINSRFGTLQPNQSILRVSDYNKNDDEMENLRKEIQKLHQENQQLKNLGTIMHHSGENGREENSNKESQVDYFPEEDPDDDVDVHYQGGKSLGDRPSIIQPHLGFVNTHQKAQTKVEPTVAAIKVDNTHLAPIINTFQNNSNIDEGNSLYTFKPSHDEFASFRSKLTHRNNSEDEDQNANSNSN